MSTPRVLLINPGSDAVTDDRLEQNLGLAYISSYLRSHGVPTDILELTGKLDIPSELSGRMDYDIYGVSVYSTSVKRTIEITRFIRGNHPDPYIVVGGPHPTALPEESLTQLGADAAVVGEGEEAMLEIAERYGSGRLRGAVRRRAAADLDALPFPDRDGVDLGSFHRKFNGEPVVSMLASRGCANRCLHCNSIVMGNTEGTGASVRFRNPRNILEEIRCLKGLGYRSIRFNDDNFTANPRLEELLDGMRREEITFWIFSHIKYLSAKNVALLEEAGCRFINIGLESLNPGNLAFLRKNNNLTHLGNLENLRGTKITLRSSFMVGLPFDTDATIEQYFEQANSLYFNEYAVYPLIPYPGTRLWSEPEKLGYTVTDRDYAHYVQLGVGGSAAYVLAYHGADNSFGPEDVRRWRGMAEGILARSKKHMRESRVAR